MSKFQQHFPEKSHVGSGLRRSAPSLISSTFITQPLGPYPPPATLNLFGLVYVSMALKAGMWEEITSGFSWTWIKKGFTRFFNLSKEKCALVQPFFLSFLTFTQPICSKRMLETNIGRCERRKRKKVDYERQALTA